VVSLDTYARAVPASNGRAMRVPRQTGVTRHVTLCRRLAVCANNYLVYQFNYSVQ